MKNKFCLIVFLVVIFLFFSVICRAEEDVFIGNLNLTEEIVSQEKKLAQKENINLAAIKKSNLEAKDFALFLCGGVAGALFHEGGHILAARLQGVELDYVDSRGWLMFNSSPSQSRIISLGGFGAQILSQEVILGADIINPFTVGWVTFNNVNTIAYIITDSVVKGGHGDFKFMRESGINTDVVKVVLLAYTAFSAYRVSKNPKIMPYFEIAKDELFFGLGWEW